ncbi:MAG: hypothetical protein ACLR7D_09175 [Lachnospira eligens]
MTDKETYSLEQKKAYEHLLVESKCRKNIEKAGSAAVSKMAQVDLAVKWSASKIAGRTDETLQRNRNGYRRLWMLSVGGDYWYMPRIGWR